MSELNQGNILLPESWAADWILDRALGSGAFSTVYRAVRKDRPSVEAAIKIISIPASRAEVDALLTDGMDEGQSQSYFDAITREYTAEIDLMEDLKGTQNIVSIEDYKVVRKPDGIGNYVFIRMELLKPLDSLLRQRQQLSEQEVIRLGIDICSALILCESKSILHRDIKPGNIFINDRMPGNVFYKLGDFGVARSLESMTGGLSRKGTPNYMAPEVFSGKPYDARADLYSLGITLYRLLNDNRLPFLEGDDLSPSAREQALSRRLGGEKLPPPAAGSSAAAQVILKACAYNPEDRYRNAREMKSALEALLKGKPVQPAGSYNADDKTVFIRQQESPLQKNGDEKKEKKTGLIAALVVCALLVLAGIVMLIARPGKGPDPEVPTAIPLAEEQSVEPTDPPTVKPTDVPTEEPTAAPTQEPTDTAPPEPTDTPTVRPTETPTEEPTAAPTQEPTDTPTQEPTAAPTPEPAQTPIPIPGSIAVGDIIRFGHYEQDNNLENGPEAIEWIVLDYDESNKIVMLLSKYGLDSKPYHTQYTRITWENCSLRKWLNEEFMNAAFSTEEQIAILTMYVDNSAGQTYWDADGGNNTQDRIFLLSYAQANLYLDVRYPSGKNLKSQMAPTAYAVAQGATVSEDLKTEEGENTGWWWLRNPGRNGSSAERVTDVGALHYNLVNANHGCVRPALWINLESGIF